jgi:glycosyltransferase involved in cell wall biosynthesis
MPMVLLTSNTDWYLYNFRMSLAEALRDDGYTVKFISPPGRYVPGINKIGFQWLAWRVDRKSAVPWKEVGSLFEFIKILRKEQPDIIHNHTIKPVIYGSLAARINGHVRVINSITGRGHIFQSTKFTDKVLRALVKWLYRLALNRQNIITIFENRADQSYFTQLEILNSGKSVVIPGTGVDPNRYIYTVKPVGIPIIVYPGRLLWEKGVGTLVQASRLLKQKSQVRIVLVGSIDLGNPSSIPEYMIRDWVKEGVVEWWGWQEDMRDVYRKSHIIALPSWGEGIPTALLEAAASGCPIVATDVPGCREVVIEGENGLLVQPEDPVGLANALLKLIMDNDLRLKMGLRGRQIVQEKFAAPIINAQTLAVYRELLQK